MAFDSIGEEKRFKLPLKIESLRNFHLIKICMIYGIPVLYKTDNEYN